MAGLMQYCVSAQFPTSRHTLSRKRASEFPRIQKGRGWLREFAFQTTGALLRTRYWRAVDPLIFETEKLLNPASLRLAYLKEFQGLFDRAQVSTRELKLL